jgi:hypothetical protein
VLYVADAVRGLLSVDTVTGAVDVVLREVEGRALKFANSLVVGPRSGLIYLTDSSARWSRSDFIYEVLQAAPTGRLIEVNPDTRHARVIVDGIAFANGIVVDPDENYLLVAELTRHQLLRVGLAALRRANAAFGGGGAVNWNARREVDDEAMSVIIDNLAGPPDNLSWESVDIDTADSEGVDASQSRRLWVGMGTQRHAPISLVDLLAPYPLVRNVLAWLVPKPLFLRLVPSVSAAVRIAVTQRVHALNPAGWAEAHIVDVLRTPSSSALRLISGAYTHEGYLYLASVSEHTHFLARVPWTRDNVTLTAHANQAVQ